VTIESERTFRIHLRGYIGVLIGAVILLAAPIGFLGSTSGATHQILAAVATAIALVTIYKLFWLRTVRWTVRDDGVHVKQGILPWRTWENWYPYETIFEAYYGRRLFGYMLGYGTLGIRRTEGTTSNVAQNCIRGAKTAAAAINGGVEAHRAAMRPVAPAAATAVVGPARRRREPRRARAAASEQRHHLRGVRGHEDAHHRRARDGRRAPRACGGGVTECR
jgi:hypothetical protein